MVLAPALGDPYSIGGERTWLHRNVAAAIGGISLGGIIVIVGIVVMLAWSVLLGLILVLVGLIAFGGFARGRWY